MGTTKKGCLGPVFLMPPHEAVGVTPRRMAAEMFGRSSDLYVFLGPCFPACASAWMGLRRYLPLRGRFRACTGFPFSPWRRSVTDRTRPGYTRTRSCVSSRLVRDHRGDMVPQIRSARWAVCSRQRADAAANPRLEPARRQDCADSVWRPRGIARRSQGGGVLGCSLARRGRGILDNRARRRCGRGSRRVAA